MRFLGRCSLLLTVTRHSSSPREGRYIYSSHAKSACQFCRAKCPLRVPDPQLLVVRQSTFDCILPVWCTNVDCSDLETEFHSLLTKTFHQLAIDIDRATRIPSYFILQRFLAYLNSGIRFATYRGSNKTLNPVMFISTGPSILPSLK